jgi:hypothetical protein
MMIVARNASQHVDQHVDWRGKIWNETAREEKEKRRRENNG